MGKGNATLIEFQYKREKENILISLKTDSTQIGTFHRIATIIYALKMDILSGELSTVIEKGREFTIDSFILQADGGDTTQAAFKLGMMMDSLFPRIPSLKKFWRSYKSKNRPLPLSFVKLQNLYLAIYPNEMKLVCIWKVVQEGVCCITFREF